MVGIRTQYSSMFSSWIDYEVVDNVYVLEDRRCLINARSSYFQNHLYLLPHRCLLVTPFTYEEMNLSEVTEATEWV